MNNGTNVMDCTSNQNMFPSKGSISQYYSPTIILGQWALDYNKECVFGAYNQAHTRKTQMHLSLTSSEHSRRT